MADKQTNGELANVRARPASTSVEKTPQQQPWPTASMMQAKAAFPSITNAATMRIEKLLAGVFTERLQTQSDLKVIASELLKANVPTPPQVEEASG